MKTSELTGAALDWAVAKCEGFVKVAIWTDHIGICKKYSFEDQVRWAPSTDWAQGGPIIEREGLTLTHQADLWAAQTDADLFAYGPTPLIAAMRCYVASKLGDEVDVPEELKSIT
jgi:hypothetical protein